MQPADAEPPSASSPPTREAELCPICLSEVPPPDDETVRVHATCRKPFHESCLDAWLGLARSGGRCPQCQGPMRRHRPARRRLDFSAPPPGRWICCGRPAPSSTTSGLVAALVCWRRLEELEIPYVRLPIVPALERHFPGHEFDYERSEEVPVIVDLNVIRDLGVPLMVLHDPEYLRAVDDESPRYYGYREVFSCLYRRRDRPPRMRDPPIVEPQPPILQMRDRPLSPDLLPRTTPPKLLSPPEPGARR